MLSARCAIIMFDVTKRRSFNCLTRWRRMIERVCEGISVVVCGNKVDLANEIKISSSLVAQSEQDVSHYFEVSALGNYNVEKPFVHLLRQILNDDDLNLVTAPALAPPTVHVDREAEMKWCTDSRETFRYANYDDTGKVACYFHGLEPGNSL